MFEVRPFKETDRLALEAIYRDCRSEAVWLPPAAKERAKFSTDTRDEMILVAVGCTDEPEGFVSVWEPEGFIHHLYVRSCSRRKGIGVALLQALEARMPEPWRIKCLRANSAATALYRVHGWKEVSSGVSEDGAFALLERT
jgi:GNAT superfamily N-acetyltransferase